MCMYLEYLVVTVRAAYKYFCTFPRSMHLTRLLLPSPPPPPRLPPPPQFVHRMYLQFVRVNRSIVLLVKYNFSTINVTTQGSAKRGH